MPVLPNTLAQSTRFRTHLAPGLGRVTILREYSLSYVLS